VYVENQKQHAEVQQTAKAVQDAALSAIADRLGVPSAPESTQSLLIVNPTSFVRDIWPSGRATLQTIALFNAEMVPNCPSSPQRTAPGSPRACCYRLASHR
jgi:hypothetical protein